MQGPELPPWMGPAPAPGKAPAAPAGPPARKGGKEDRPVKSYNPLAREEGEESDEDSEVGSVYSESSEEYDEEVNRRREYLSRLQRQAQEMYEIRQQQAALHEYRAEQELKAKLAEEMAAMKASMMEEEAWAHCDEDEELRHARRAEQAAATIARAMDQEHVYGSVEVAQLWACFTDDWARLEASPPSQIKMQDIPWPPDNARLLNVMALEEIHAAETSAYPGDVNKPSSSDKAYQAYKRAFRKASLRWHPDKFESKFGARMSGDAYQEGQSHKEAIEARVQEVVQAINESWEKIQGSQ